MVTVNRHAFVSASTKATGFASVTARHVNKARAVEVTTIFLLAQNASLEKTL